MSPIQANVASAGSHTTILSIREALEKVESFEDGISRGISGLEPGTDEDEVGEDREANRARNSESNPHSSSSLTGFPRGDAEPDA